MRGVERPAYQPMRDVRRVSTLAAVRQRQEQEAARAAARRSQLRLALVPIALVVLAVVAGYWWWSHRQWLPSGILRADGRLEIPEISVTLPFAGKLSDVAVNGGDAVSAGQVLARLDVSGAQAELDRLEGVTGDAKAALDAAQSELAQRRAQGQAAEQEVRLAMAHGTKQALDQRRAARDIVNAALAKALATQSAAEQALASAREQSDKLKAQIAQDKLLAPHDGRVADRFAEPGEALPAGAVVLTLMDPASVFARVGVPPEQATRATVGDEARLRLDNGDVQLVSAGTVSFVGPAESSEGKRPIGTEASKALVAVKIRADESLLRAPLAALHNGAAVTAYIRVSPDAVWPAFLRPHS
jgi:HlyD family secretion protein